MPLYHYYCKDGHETPLFTSIGSRPEEIECSTCGRKARRGLRTDATDDDISRPEDSRLVMHDYACIVCEHEFEEIEEYCKIDEMVCPECGGDTRIVLSGFNTDTSSQNRYPYFDRGLGIMLHSKEHRRKVCKERGLRPVDGDYDVGRDLGFDEEMKQAKEEEEAYDAYLEELETHPMYRAYRESRDKGQIEDYRQ
jgi:putative FmdB family regulatory protein